jgi:hypothetical protein
MQANDATFLRSLPLEELRCEGCSDDEGAPVLLHGTLLVRCEPSRVSTGFERLQAVVSVSVARNIPLVSPAFVLKALVVVFPRLCPGPKSFRELLLALLELLFSFSELLWYARLICLSTMLRGDSKAADLLFMGVLPVGGADVGLEGCLGTS